MMVPKLRFSPGLKAKAPGAVTACVPAIPARSDAARRNFYRPVDHDWHKKQRWGRWRFFFFLPSRVFQVYDCYFTNVLTQRSCLGFLLTADSQCFTRNDARTFVPTIPRWRLWLGERSLWVETSRSSFTAKVWSFSPQAPPSPVSSPSKYPPSFVALAFNKTKPVLSSIAVVTKAIKRTARTSLSHLRNIHKAVSRHLDKNRAKHRRTVFSMKKAQKSKQRSTNWRRRHLGDMQQQPRRWPGFDKCVETKLRWDVYIRPWPPGWSFLRRTYTSRGSERVKASQQS